MLLVSNWYAIVLLRVGLVIAHNNLENHVGVSAQVLPLLCSLCVKPNAGDS